MTLFDLSDQYFELLEQLEDSDCDPEIIEDSLKLLKDDIEIKAANYGKIIKELEYNAKNLKDIIEKMSSRKAALEDRVQFMKKQLLTVMKLQGKKTMRTDMFTFTIRDSNSAVVIDDEEAIPTDFLIEQPPKINKKMIKEYLADENNPAVPFAHLETKETIAIR